MRILYRTCVERSQFQVALKIRNFHPSLIFGDLTPPTPDSKKPRQSFGKCGKQTTGLTAIGLRCGPKPQRGSGSLTRCHEIRFKSGRSQLKVLPKSGSNRLKSSVYEGAECTACAFLCCKNMCCASRFCMGGRGAAGSKSQQMSKGP